MSRPKTVNTDAPFQSPRNAAIISGLSVAYIREGCKSGKIPHIRVGVDYRVNMPRFLDLLEKESQVN